MMNEQHEQKRRYPKNSWSRGEWDREPDRVDFVHAGYACFIMRNTSGILCGYVGVPREHPFYEKDSMLLNDLDVHGGVTYTSKCQGHLCHVPEPGMPDDVWWIGFDTGHHMDLVPLQEGLLGPHRAAMEVKETYRNLDYVRAEVMYLAEQLRERQMAYENQER